MAIISTGFGLRRRAQEGMSAVAKLEAQENQQRIALEQAKQAQEMSMYGTFGGIGASAGVPKAIEAYKAATAGGAVPAAPTGFVSPSGGMSALAKGSNATAALRDVPAVTGNAAQGFLSPQGGGGALAQSANAVKDAKAVTDAVQTTKAVTDTGTAVKTATDAKLAGDAVVAANTAGGAGSGMLAGLSAIAAPLAIGLGAAYLINKLFD